MHITFANKITIFRILCVPAFIVTVLYYSSLNVYLKTVALAIFLFATLSDVVDGYIARKFHQSTKMGALLDPLADKLLLMSAFACLFIKRAEFGVVQLPFWLLVVVMSRDIILLAGSVILHITNSQMKIEPTLAGKLTTFFQVLAILGIFFQWSWSFYLWAIVLVLAIATTVDYIKRNIQPAG
ncbi:MAG TPA: CDP-alcohol phosphatidyltransferase family protein [Candidatus Omnitrophota bacterium]|nr:CDP-alcohol phosphatidyltransferase family protein [Candidatus Omnitrophota bacterium]